MRTGTHRCRSGTRGGPRNAVIGRPGLAHRGPVERVLPAFQPIAVASSSFPYPARTNLSVVQFGCPSRMLSLKMIVADRRCGSTGFKTQSGQAPKRFCNRCLEVRGALSAIFRTFQTRQFLWLFPGSGGLTPSVCLSHPAPWVPTVEIDPVRFSFRHGESRPNGYNVE